MPSSFPPGSNYSNSSPAERFLRLPIDERRKRIKSLSEAEADALQFCWEGWWARPNQIVPAGDWATWLVKAGRGFGKTRVGAETVRKWVKDFALVNIIGPTAADARDVMVQGPSGILAVCPSQERPEYIKSERLLRWPNGAKSLVFSADEPERLRGPQCCKLWGDELAAWRYADEAWDNSQFGLRLGSNPQAIVTTTPRPTPLVRQLLKDSDTFITNGITHDNRSNLSEKFFQKIIVKYEGTRLGRQEIYGELLEDNPGALWTHQMIEELRVKKIPDLVRIVVGVDPAVTANEDSDETGIVVAGMDRQTPPHFYVIDDATVIASPGEWAAAVVNTYRTQNADRIVAEVNNGGDLVEAVLRTKDLSFAYKAVHASRGKITRAEPIAALYEQKRVHHVGIFPKLEDQMCDFNPQTSTKSPDRMDALVWSLWELDDSRFSHGLVEYWSGEAQKPKAQPSQPTAEEKATQPQSEKDEMFGRTVAPKTLGKVATSDQQSNKCPKCGNAFPSQFAENYKCGACGHSWPTKK